MTSHLEVAIRAAWRGTDAMLVLQESEAPPTRRPKMSANTNTAATDQGFTAADILAAYTNAVAIVADADTAHMSAQEIVDMINYTAAGIADAARRGR